jgi:hypothetical protein
MAFGVFRGNRGPSPENPAAAPTDSAEPIGPVLERLEALASALEALEGGGQLHAADSVLDTLSRMERRDLQAVSAIDTFATALKSVSHHLAHLRQSVHTSNTQSATKLDALTERLSGIEARLGAGLLDSIDLSPMAAMLDTIGQRLSGLEGKLDALATQQAHWPFDTDAFATALATIADRLARVEAKVDRVAQQPALEPETTANILSAIVQRMTAVENKVDTGADGTSIAACLLAVDRRLSHIESGLGMDRPMPSASEIPDLTDVVAVSDPLEVVHDLVAVPILPEHDAGGGMPQPQYHAAPEHHAEPPPALIPPAEEAPAPPPNDAGSRDRVDQLLEQVFRVLAR